MFHVEHLGRKAELGNGGRNFSHGDENLAPAVREPLKHAALVVAVEFGREIVEGEDGLFAGDLGVEIGLRKQGSEGGELGLPS